MDDMDRAFDERNWATGIQYIEVDEKLTAMFEVNNERNHSGVGIQKWMPRRHIKI